MSTDWMPGTTRLLLPEAHDQGRYVKTQCIFHSTGTTAGARANARYFARTDVKIESTMIVDYDGEILQLMPASARADANLSASERAISVEVIGTADEPYTPAQVRSCIAIARWACVNHPIPRRQIPQHDLGGIGWHVMFGAPGPWTSVRGKQCPGPQRIEQVRTVIIPAAKAWPSSDLRTPTPTVSKEITMLIVDDPGAAPDGNRQWICDTHTKRHSKDWNEVLGLRSIGVPHLEEEPETVAQRAAVLAARREVTA